LHTFACLYTALRSNPDFEAFCTQVGLHGGVYRVHKHARHGGVSWRGRIRHPIRQAATSIASSASVFQPEQTKPTSTASPTSTSRDGFATNFRYRNQMRDSAQGHVLQLVEAFLSRLAPYKPTHPALGELLFRCASYSTTRQPDSQRRPSRFAPSALQPPPALVQLARGREGALDVPMPWQARQVQRLARLARVRLLMKPVPLQLMHLLSYV
jgi:hypothetical protein